MRTLEWEDFTRKLYQRILSGAGLKTLPELELRNPPREGSDQMPYYPTGTTEMDIASVVISWGPSPVHGIKAKQERVVRALRSSHTENHSMHNRPPHDEALMMSPNAEHSRKLQDGKAHCFPELTSVLGHGQTVQGREGSELLQVCTSLNGIPS